MRMKQDTRKCFDSCYEMSKIEHQIYLFKLVAI